MVARTFHNFSKEATHSNSEVNLLAYNNKEEPTLHLPTQLEDGPIIKPAAGVDPAGNRATKKSSKGHLFNFAASTVELTQASNIKSSTCYTFYNYECPTAYGNLKRNVPCMTYEINACSKNVRFQLQNIYCLPLT